MFVSGKCNRLSKGFNAVGLWFNRKLWALSCDARRAEAGRAKSGVGFGEVPSPPTS